VTYLKKKKKKGIISLFILSHRSPFFILAPAMFGQKQPESQTIRWSSSCLVVTDRDSGARNSCVRHDPMEVGALHRAGLAVGTCQTSRFYIEENFGSEFEVDTVDFSTQRPKWLY
jgi:hypothetical protein